MTDLDRELRALAADTVWPPTPDVAPAVRARVTGVAQRRRPVGRIMAAVAVTAGLVAVSPVGAEIGDQLGIAGGERVTRVPSVPEGQSRVELGHRVSLAEAQRIGGRAVALPRALPAPDAIRVGGEMGAGAVTLVYGREHVLTTFPRVRTVTAGKLVGPGVTVVGVRVRGAAGLWIARGPRILTLATSRGTLVRRAAALPGAGVLLFDRAGAGARLETRSGLATALRIARSLPR